MTLPRSGRTLGLLLGAGLDAVVADPRRAHPVAAFGRAAAASERLLWADSRRRGAAFVLGWLGAVVGSASLAERAVGSARWRTAATAVAAWAVLGGTTLAREGVAMQRLLAAGNVAGARLQLSHLCGRDAGDLTSADLARATVESLAENTSDAVVAPLWWAALAGAPGLVGYRAVNTLDAMIGHRSPRYERFGWASARLDDVANLVPARLTGVLTAVAAPLVGGSPRAALRVLRRDGAAHPSPNAGQCEAAFAGALGVRLGGSLRYGNRVESRAMLGDGPPPNAADIARAVRLSRAVGVAALCLATVVSWLQESWLQKHRHPAAGRRP